MSYNYNQGAKIFRNIGPMTLVLVAGFQKLSTFFQNF